jgi:hypothetical protein
MEEMTMRSYEAARSYFSFFGFLSWCVIVIGGLLAVAALVAVGQMSRSYGGSSMAGIAGILPGVGIMFAGFLGLVVVQIGRAGVDSAEYAQQSLKISREQLEISRASQRTSTRDTEGFAVMSREAEKPSASFADQVQADKVSKAGQKSIAAPTSPPSDRVALGLENGQLEYQTKSIDVRNGQFLYNGIPFDTLISAQKYIDKLGKIPARKLPPKAG